MGWGSHLGCTPNLSFGQALPFAVTMQLVLMKEHPMGLVMPILQMTKLRPR